MPLPLPVSAPEYFWHRNRSGVSGVGSISNLIMNWTNSETILLMDRVYGVITTLPTIQGELRLWKGDDSDMETLFESYEVRGMYLSDERHFAIELTAFDKTFRPQVRLTSTVGQTTWSMMLTPRMKTSLIAHKIKQISDLVIMERL